MKAKLKNLIRDLIIGRDAPTGTFKNKQVTDFFIRARNLPHTEPYKQFEIDEHDEDGKTIRSFNFNSITLGVVIHVLIRTEGDKHHFLVFTYDFLEDFR